MESEGLLDELINLLLETDECLAKDDTNSATKKVHEAIAVIKKYNDMYQAYNKSIEDLYLRK